MKTIWKVAISAIHKQSVSLPVGAEPLCVAGQGGIPHVWFSVDTETPTEYRIFGFTGTGCAIPVDIKKYLGTAICEPFVWHVFEFES